VQTLWQDLRYALRVLAKSPGFTTVVVLTLALGIGANTAIFSAVNGVLLRRLPYAEASRLVSIVREKTSGDSGEQVGLITPLPSAIAQNIQAQCPAFDGFTTYGFGEHYRLTGQSAPELLSGTAVSGDFFAFFEVRPLFGRPILSSDTTAGNGDVVELSYDVWKRLLGGDPQWVGKKITLSGKQYTVIGVMPPKFDMGISPKNGIWLPRVPMPDDATNRVSGFLDVLARMKTTTTVSQAQVELNTLESRLAATYPKTDAGWTLLARPLDTTDSDIKQGLLLLLAASAFVLLIACVNVSGLLLARGWGRQREVAIREALGATRLRIIRQFLSESALLAFLGGALGLLFSAWAIRVLRVLAAPYTSNVDDIKLDAPVLGFTLGVALLAGILFGLMPALRQVGATLKGAPAHMPSGYSGRHPRKVRSALIVVEAALAVVLVIGATLVARSFENLTSVKLGFRTDHILTLAVNFDRAVCDPDKENRATQCQLAMQNVLAGVKSLPGVESVAIASSIPTRGASVGMDLRIEGQRQTIGFSAGSPVFKRNVSEDYFSAIGMRLLQGRGFAAADMSGERSAIVNELFARKFLSGQPLGKRISERMDKSGQPEWLTIVGEVNDSRDWGVEAEAFPELYVPYGKSNDNPIVPALIVRTADNPLAMTAAVKKQIWTVDPDAPITGLATLDQIVSDDVAQPRFQAVLLGSFGALGLILALVGIYGVISYAVTQRTREFGVRMALGARPGNILRMVIREGMLLVMAGIALGLGSALALGRVLQSMLFGLKPTDPATFVCVTIALALAALAACHIPARRAMKVDPMVALRYE
jgi:putative ABC transport system permease protein